MSDEDSTVRETPARPVRAFLWRNIALIAAAGPFVLAGIRVLLYSGGDPVVLRTLIETLNVPTVLLGTFVPLLPAFVLLGIQAVMYNGNIFGGVFRTRIGIVSVSVVVFFYALIAPFPSGVVTIGSIFGGLLLGEITRQIVLRHMRRPARHARGAALKPERTARPAPSGFTLFGNVSFISGTSWIVYGAVAIFILALPFAMWVPLERISLSSGSSVVTYVLDESDSWTTTIATDKSIRIIATEDIVKRSVCKQGDFTSLLTMIGRSEPSPNDKCET